MQIENLVRSRELAATESGDLLRFSRQEARWEWMGFSVRRMVAGEKWESEFPGEETVYVLLSGRCAAAWDSQNQRIGKRRNVFDGLPYALYLAPGGKVRFHAETACE